jgi:hypothetical protein
MVRLENFSASTCTWSGARKGGELLSILNGQGVCIHKRQDFKLELLELLDRHEVEYDLRYVFD